MKKKDAQFLKNRCGEKTAEYVFAHAKWQCSRNRKPSESYKKESNPKRALALATEELKIFKPVAGIDISFVADRMVKICHLTENSVTARFNGIELVASPGDISNSVVNLYHKELKRQAEEYRVSPEGKSEAHNTKRREKRLQEKADRLVEKLFDKFDFTNLETVINWLDEFENPSNKEIPHEKILKEFRNHGFEPGVNCGDDFDKTDRNKVAYWLIGRALTGLECRVHAIHQVFSGFAEKWRKKFISKPKPTK